MIYHIWLKNVRQIDGIPRDITDLTGRYQRNLDESVVKELDFYDQEPIYVSHRSLPSQEHTGKEHIPEGIFLKVAY